MDWLQILTLFFANAGLVLWMRSEARNDWRHMDAKIDAIREETKAIQLEMKDFHNRLCAIEERRCK